MANPKFPKPVDGLGKPPKGKDPVHDPKDPLEAVDPTTVETVQLKDEKSGKRRVF